MYYYHNKIFKNIFKFCLILLYSERVTSLLLPVGMVSLGITRIGHFKPWLLFLCSIFRRFVRIFSFNHGFSFFVKKSLYFVFIKDQILSCFDALAGPGAIFKCLCPKHNRETLIIIFCQTDEKRLHVSNYQ